MWCAVLVAMREHLNLQPKYDVLKSNPDHYLTGILAILRTQPKGQEIIAELERKVTGDLWWQKS